MPTLPDCVLCETEPVAGDPGLELLLVLGAPSSLDCCRVLASEPFLPGLAGARLGDSVAGHLELDRVPGVRAAGRLGEQPRGGEDVADGGNLDIFGCRALECSSAVGLPLDLVLNPAYNLVCLFYGVAVRFSACRLGAGRYLCPV